MASQSSVIGLLRVLLSANVAEYETAMKRAGDTTKKTTKDIKDSATEITSVGGKIAQSLGVPADVISSVGKLSGALTTLGLATAGLKIADLVSDFVDFAGEISDLSERTEIPIRQLQRLQYAGDLVGVSIDQISAAVGQMQNRLAGGDKGALNALEQLNLAWDELRNLDPGAQFEAIAAEIAKIPDPAERTHVAMELFGRSGAALLPLLKQNLKEIGDEGERLGAVIGEDLIRSGDRLGDSWTKLQNIGFGLFAKTLTPLLDYFDRLPSDINTVSVAIDTLKGKIQELPEVKASQAVKNLFGPDVDDPKKFYADALRERRLTADEIKAIEADATKAAEQAAKKTDQWAESIKQLRDQLSGAKLQQDVRRLQAAVNGLTEDERKNAVVTERVAEAAHKLFEQGAILTPQLMRLVIENGNLAKSLPPVISGLEGLTNVGELANDHFERTLDIVERLIPKLEVVAGLGSEFRGVGAIPLPEPPDLDPWLQRFEQFESDIKNLALRAGQDFAALLGEGIATGNWAGFEQGLRDLLAQAIGAGISAAVDLVVPGLGTMLNPLFQGIGKWLSNAFNDEGRDLVEEFAKSIADEAQVQHFIDTGDWINFDGFDELHRRLQELGEEGERLWILLTQKVGRNDTDQAIAAINAVSAALARGARTAEESGQRQEDAAKKMVDGIQKEYDRLTNEIDRLTQSIADEAPEEVMGVVERQTRERIALIEQERRDVGEKLEAATAAIEDHAKQIGNAVDDHIGKSIEDIGSDLDRNAKQWEEWHGRVAAAVSGLRIGVELPEPPDGGIPGFQGGTHGQFVDFGPRTLAWLHGRERIVTEHEALSAASLASAVPASSDGGGFGMVRSTAIMEVDKRILGRVVADVLPGELRRLGVRVRS